MALGTVYQPRPRSSVVWGAQTRSRRQLIVMDQPAEEFASPHTCRGRCAERRPSVWAVESEPTVRTRGVVVPYVGPQHHFEVSAPEDQQMVKGTSLQIRPLSSVVVASRRVLLPPSWWRSCLGLGGVISSAA
jgi:hypothetical protein